VVIVLSLGEKILSARQDLLLTQRELAEKLNVTTTSVSRWERDETIPNWRNIRLIAELTGKPRSFFVDEVAA
jgi:transcriptional regulator with XRE-family HTH domain